MIHCRPDSRRKGLYVLRMKSMMRRVDFVLAEACRFELFGKLVRGDVVPSRW